MLGRSAQALGGNVRMNALGRLTWSLVGMAAPAVMVLGLGACGPEVTSGNEETVYIKVGPLTSFSDTQSFAQDYCAQYGKRASVEGSNPDPATLEDTYRFNCVEDPQ